MRTIARFLSLVAGAGVVAGAIVHILSLAGAIRSLEGITAPLIGGAMALGLGGIVVCIHLAVSRGIVGRQAQWAYFIARCPVPLRRAAIVVIAYAALWLVAALVRNGGKGIRLDEAPPALVSVVLMNIYFVLLCLFQAYAAGDGPGNASRT
jgi:hypothetical protein